MSRAATRLADLEPSLASTIPEPAPGLHQESGDEPLAGPQVFYGKYAILWQPVGTFPYKQLQVHPLGVDDQPAIHFVGSSESWPAEFSDAGGIPRLTGICVLSDTRYSFDITLVQSTPPHRWVHGNYLQMPKDEVEATDIENGPVEVGMWGAEDDGGQVYKRSPQDAPTSPRPHLLRP